LAVVVALLSNIPQKLEGVRFVFKIFIHALMVTAPIEVLWRETLQDTTETNDRSL
jgi:hypothetical protein